MLRDLDNHPHHVNVFKPITRRSVGRGRRTLTSDQKRRLEGLIGADLERLGYAPVC
jgi:hypothetical protein